MTTKTRLKRGTVKNSPVCYFHCGKSIDTYVYARALIDGISYAVCGEGCAKWPEEALFIGFSTKGKRW